ncbi:MAG: UDP-N-acetylglucosamine 2-epimerase [Clostridiales bacterium GWF2_38_85]|nr:MAG: UDP-N-acetylglucosamine 2-epimerase [Clostridiales bacterium GWF2_38_85]HBL84096.1 UDP-N-acetylglucosamine 2-epimerase (non-hydrolyzing) [Clostridiales bacterium]
MQKLMFVYGTRPEAIKLAKLIKLTKQNTNFDVVICSTGQQKDLINNVNSALGIYPDIDLNLMRSNEPFEKQHMRYSTALFGVFKQETPNAIVIHGDTATALSSANAANELNIPVFHVEAGLRSGNIASPYPEEYIRTKIAQIATLHFAPTESAKQNLIYEKVNGEIYVTGNTEIDALKSTLEISIDLNDIYPFLDLQKNIIFVTVHRTENRNDKLKNIFNALIEISKRDDVQIIYSMHPNKIIQKASHMLKKRPNIFIISPPSPIITHNLLNHAFLIISDSGGLQEDAAYLQKPILVLRNETERVELITYNVGILVGSDTALIVENANKLFNNNSTYEKMCSGHLLYGDGTASEQILDCIIKYFNTNN